MATLQQPSIAFTSSSQTSVRVSFQVNFVASELGPIQLSIFSARVFFKVIRIVPKPFVAGTPPPPLPAPVTLNTVTLRVPRPITGNIRSLHTDFTYTFAANSILITDHLLAEIRLRRNIFNTIDTKTTHDVVLTVSDLASPQPSGVIIP